ncbi:MAG: hypothetical protein M1308_00610, partial [Actinobacteria bacterium]|nr:hypothetical protein [Actinomycetota bacterium]
LVILGADAINANGDAVNKVGSFGASLSAKANNIPLYVVSSLLKFTLGLHIEKRSEDEIWRDKPENLKILNLAFDKIPAEYITYFITEKGLLKPSEISEAVRKYYPWIINESFYDR